MTSQFFKQNIPNFLTIIRIILAPICIYLIIKQFYLLSLVLFLCASITDFFDGFIARKYNYISKIGSFLDPIADKFLVFGVFFTFYLNDIIIDQYILIMIIFRDLLVTSIRSVMESKGVTMVTTFLAKVKTTIQFSVIIIIYFCLIFNYDFMFPIIYQISLIMAVITVYTGFDYFFKNFKNLSI